MKYVIVVLFKFVLKRKNIPWIFFLTATKFNSLKQNKKEYYDFT